jgi:hypothetical protein
MPLSTPVVLMARLGGLIAVLLIAGCSSQPARTPTPQSTTAPSTPTPSPTLAPTQSPSPSASGVGLTSGLRPESVTFISPDVGWVLGLSTCGNAQCLRLAKTVDAGRSWTWVSGVALPALSMATRWELRFADTENGWISGSLLFATHDGGHTWRRIAFPGAGTSNAYVAALEAADGRVYAEIAEGTNRDTYGPVVLFGSLTRSDSWYPVPAVTTGAAGFAGEISLAQGVFWVMLHPAIVTPRGNQSQSALYRSLDGVTWRREPLPCPSETVAAVAAATSSRVFVVCGGGGAAGSQSKSAYRSDNGGASYVRVTDPPFEGNLQDVAASPTSVSVAAASGATFISASFDAGRTWVGSLSIGDGGLGLSDLGFTTALQGVVIHGMINYPQTLQLLMTRDGGHTWTTVVVNPT